MAPKTSLTHFSCVSYDSRRLRSIPLRKWLSYQSCRVQNRGVGSRTPATPTSQRWNR